MSLRLFAHERRQVDEHRVVALGATDPQILRDRLFGCTVDRLRILTGKTRARLTDDLLAGRASAFRA